MTAEPDSSKPSPWRRFTRGLPTWMERHPLTKDVYTRTVATVLSAAIIAGIAAVVGLIQLNAAGWGLVGLVAALIAAWPTVWVLTVRVNEDSRADARAAVYAGVALVLAVTWLLVFRDAIGFRPGTGPSCDEFDGEC